jgi:hypothetical protein
MKFMGNYLIDRLRIRVDGVPWWWRLAYLVPDPFLRDSSLAENVAKFAKGQDKTFNAAVETHVAAYLEKGTMPPAPIVGPILNIAEDIAAGRDVTLRAGDYIALQTFVRSQAPRK